jgi:ABC-2 type transport system permease protein
MNANAEFKRVREWAWIRGFTALYQKENRAWWSTKRWWINALLWIILQVALEGVMIFLFPAMAGMTGQTDLVEANGGLAGLGLSAFFQLGTLAITFGVIILCQDLIIGEKQSGLTEGMLSKPVQRKAYVLSKLFASLVAILMLLIILPSAAVYALITFRIGQFVPLQPYLVGIGLLIIHSLFYLTLTLMLGVFFNGRSPILGIGIGIYFIGKILAGMIKPLMYIGPWVLLGFAEAISIGQPVPTEMLWPPLIATGFWCVVFTVAALIQFERTEF